MIATCVGGDILHWRKHRRHAHRVPLVITGLELVAAPFARQGRSPPAVMQNVENVRPELHPARLERRRVPTVLAIDQFRMITQIVALVAPTWTVGLSCVL